MLGGRTWEAWGKHAPAESGPLDLRSALQIGKDNDFTQLYSGRRVTQICKDNLSVSRIGLKDST